MERIHRFVTAVVIVCFTFAATGVASAQSALTFAVDGAAGAAPPQAPATGDTMAAGLIDGELLAEGHRTGGKFGVGLGVGVLTGLIGTGIGYFVVGPESPSPEILLRGEGRSADYQLGLKTGYERKTKSKKRNAFLAGGLLGTAAFVLVLVSAQGGQ